MMAYTETRRRSHEAGTVTVQVSHCTGELPAECALAVNDASSLSHDRKLHVFSLIVFFSSSC